MLINNPWQMAPLKLIYDIVGGFYPIVISVGQSLLTFYISFGVYKLIIYLINKKEGRV